MPHFEEIPAVLESFLQSSVVRYFQVRCSSMRTPKNFTYLVLFKLFTNFEVGEFWQFPPWGVKEYKVCLLNV